MTLLVTGGAGFIGTNFILYWLKYHPDDRIVNFDKLTYAGNLENLSQVEKYPHYTFIHGDICNKTAVKKALKNVSVVVHFAAESHVDRSIISPDVFAKTNVLGTQVVLESCRQSGITHFHHISTDEVYGSLKLNDPGKFDENTTYNPRSPYAASKAAADHFVRSYYYTYGLPITISNCSNNYGPYQFPEKFIPLAITNIMEGKKVPVYGDGLNVRDWLYVEDHCRAIELILEKGRIGETYCIGGTTQEINNISIAKKITSFMGVDDSVIDYIKDRPGHDRRYAMNWSKINRDLGWKPLADFDSYLTKTIEWYKNNPGWCKRVKSGDYQSYYKRQYGDN